MDIVGYDEDKQTLQVRFNTKTVWEYSPVELKIFKKIISDKTDKTLVYFLRHTNLVGLVKEVK